MAYNNKNLYTRIIDIQNLVLDLKQKDEDITYKEIYWQHVFPVWRVSYRTFHSYLGTPAKRELKKLQEIEQQQLNLFNENNQS